MSGQSPVPWLEESWTQEPIDSTHGGTVHTIAREWNAHPGPGAVIGFALTLLFGFLGFIALIMMFTQSGAAFFAWGLIVLSLSVAAGGSCLLALVALRLRYHLDDEALVIDAPGFGWAVPYRQIIDVRHELQPAGQRVGWERFWPGLRIGSVRESGRTRRFAATAGPAHRIQVVCIDGTIIELSPWRPIQFITALETMRIATPLANLPDSAVEGRVQERADRGTGHAAGHEPATGELSALQLLRIGVLRDRAMSSAIALSLTLIACMGLYTVYRVDGVYQPLPARWNAVGEVEYWLRPDGPWVFEGIWLYVVIGLCVLITNMSISTLLLLIDRHLARLVVLVTPAIEVAVLVALFRATT